VVENNREDGQTRISRRVTQHQHAVVDRNSDEVENEGEDGLDHRDNETAMDDELGENGRALVRQATVPQDKPAKLLEFIDGEVRGERCLHALFTDDTHTNVRLQNHTDIVTTITNRACTLASELTNLVRNGGLLSRAATTNTDRGRLRRTPKEALFEALM